MLEVPPPTPWVNCTFNPVSCSMRMSSISPRMYCSVMGLVAMWSVSFDWDWRSDPPMIPAQRSSATAAKIRFCLFALTVRFFILRSMNPRRKSITSARSAISKLPAIVIAALLVVIPR